MGLDIYTTEGVKSKNNHFEILYVSILILLDYHFFLFFFLSLFNVSQYGLNLNMLKRKEGSVCVCSKK